MGHEWLHNDGQRPEQPLWNRHHGQLSYCLNLKGWIKNNIQRKDILLKQARLYCVGIERLESLKIQAVI